jgi:hypothetical protein
MFRTTPILLCLALAGCGGGTDSDIATAYTLSMRVGQQFVISEEALTVTFTGVTDSRCPTQVLCVWAGEGTVTLVVSQSGYPSESLLIVTPASPGAQPSNQSSYRAFRFTLESLDPSPAMPGPIPIELYRASVLIEKR